MNSILTDVSSPAVAEAIEANLFDYIGYWRRSPSVESYDSPSLTWCATGIPHPFANAVVQTRTAVGNLDALIDNLLDVFKARDAPFSWWVARGCEPAGLGRHLEARGLAYSEQIRGMAIDLGMLRTAPLPPSGLSVLPVDDYKALGRWVDAAVAGFGLPGGSEQACLDLFAGLGYHLPLRCYVGLLGGKPVAVSHLFIGAGVAGVYWVTTIPEARRRGFGSALTLAALADAYDLGYRVGILHPSQSGLRVYSRLGFQQRCRLRCAIWRGEDG
jgi:GNAT superfamily N-acetyltransferase